MDHTLLTPEGLRDYLGLRLVIHQRHGDSPAQGLTLDQVCRALVGLHRETRSPIGGLEGHAEPPLAATALEWVRTTFAEEIGLLTLVCARALDEAWVRGERTDDAQRTAVRQAMARFLHP